MESNHAPDPRDPLIFQSVWQRVTAGQEESPIALLPPPGEKTFPPVREAAPQLLLEGWMDRLAAGVRDTLALARRWPGPVSRLAWSQLRTLRNQLRRLDTGHFLLTGRRFTPQGAEPSLPPLPRDNALRQHWLRFRQWAEQAQAEGDRVSCAPVRLLCYGLSRQSAELAREIQTFLEHFGAL